MGNRRLKKFVGHLLVSKIQCQWRLNSCIGERDIKLRRLVSVHSNFAEYVPLRASNITPPSLRAITERNIGGRSRTLEPKRASI